MAFFDEVQYCLNPTCRGEMPVDAHVCPHCGRITPNGEEAEMAAAKAEEDSLPFWKELAITGWPVLGWVLFLPWLAAVYGAWWGRVHSVEEFSVLRAALWGIPALLWWIADMVMHQPRVWQIVVGALLVLFALFPTQLSIFVLAGTWVYYWTRIRSEAG